MIGISFHLLLMLNDRILSRIEGARLFSMIIVYIFYSFFLARKEFNKTAVDDRSDPGYNPVRKPWIDTVMVVAGIAMLIAGAKFFVSGDVSVAKMLQISDVVIGLTIVAVGTTFRNLPPQR